MSIKCDSEGQPVLALTETVLDDKVDNGFVLLVLGTAFLRPAAFNELFNALIDEDDRELIATVGDVELRLRAQGVLEGLVVVIEVEIEFGEQEGDEGSIGEGGVFVESLDEIDVVGDVDPVERDVREESPDAQLLEIVIFLLQ
jgi:hypothetical protein